MVVGRHEILPCTTLAVSCYHPWLSEKIGRSSRGTFPVRWGKRIFLTKYIPITKSSFGDKLNIKPEYLDLLIWFQCTFDFNLVDIFITVTHINLFLKDLTLWLALCKTLSEHHYWKSVFSLIVSWQKPVVLNGILYNLL